MDRQAALGIIGDNYNARGESFLFYLHERDLFSRGKFDELCESIETLCGGQRDTEVLWMLTRIESAVLKELIYHFNEEDSLQIVLKGWTALCTGTITAANKKTSLSANAGKLILFCGIYSIR